MRSLEKQNLTKLYFVFTANYKCLHTKTMHLNSEHGKH